MADVPQGLTLKHHRDLHGRERRPIARRILLALLAAFLLLGLLNVFGQRPQRSEAASAPAVLEVRAPTRLRSGLYFEGRFRIRARQELEEAVLVLHPDWLDGVTLNTVEPAPVGEASRDGQLALTLGRVPAGDEYVLFLHFQVNPTATGVRTQQVRLFDGGTLLASVERRAVIWP